jgi:hypothetical protein
VKLPGYRDACYAQAESGGAGCHYPADNLFKIFWSDLKEEVPDVARAVGARAQTLSRLFNLREGFTAEDDRLPRRVRQAFEGGPLAE